MLKKSGKQLLLFFAGLVFFISAFAPYDIFAAGFCGLIPLLLIVKESNFIKTFVLSALFFLLVNIWQLQFVVSVMVNYGSSSNFFALLALIFLSLFLALLSALFFSLPKLLRLGFWSLPFFFTLKEIWQEKIFSGFPWCLCGYTQSSNIWFLQWAEYGGIYFITFLVVLANILLFYLLTSEKKRRWLLTAALFFLFFHSFGYFIYHRTEQKLNRLQQHKAGVIQPATVERVFSPAEILSELQKLLQESAELARAGAELIVWPEYSLPVTPAQTPFYLSKFSEFAAKYVPLLAGFNDEQEDKIYNAAFLFSKNGQQVYYKQHLTPFGEYIPLRAYLFFARRIVEAMADFSAGTSSLPLDLNGHKLGVAICYEIIFTNLVRKIVSNGAEVLITISNDSWFGRSQAPWQHLSMAVVRAVENRRYLIRSTTSGISALVQPTGKVVYRSALFAQEKRLLKFSYIQEKSFYLKAGHYFSEFCLFCCFLFTVFQAGRLKRKSLPELTSR